MSFKAYCVHSMLPASGTDIWNEMLVVVYSHEMNAFQLLVVKGLMNVCFCQTQQQPNIMGGRPSATLQHLENKLWPFNLFIPATLQHQHWQPPKEKNGFAGFLVLNIALDFKISRYLPQNVKLDRSLISVSTFGFLLLQCLVFSIFITLYSYSLPYLIR